MKAGQESRTAVMACMGRAAAHGERSGTSFQDPTALALLPLDARARVRKFLAGERTGGVRGALERVHLRGLSRVMTARTVAIDDAIRSAGSPQLVVLGAGLDGRAWRMPDLREVVVYEVDHPDSQREKRARVAALAPAAREVRFVPVDFSRGELDRALARAGHDPDRPTTWVWEAVIMYLTRSDIEATLAVVERRSAAGSRLVVAYHSPALVLRIAGPLLRRLGEPLRSAFTAAAMRSLLAEHGFSVVQDRDLRTIGATSTPEVARATRFIDHLRIATADRRERSA